MPKNFVVPRTPYWPELAHGLPLGARVVALRARSIHALDTEGAETAERVEVLTRLGFEWQKANAPATSKRFDIVLSGCGTVESLLARRVRSCRGVGALAVVVVGAVEQQ